MCLLPMVFVAPCRKRYCTTLHPTNSLPKSTRRHKVHVRLDECGLGVCYGLENGIACNDV